MMVLAFIFRHKIIGPFTITVIPSEEKYFYMLLKTIFLYLLSTNWECQFPSLHPSTWGHFIMIFTCFTDCISSYRKHELVDVVLCSVLLDTQISKPWCLPMNALVYLEKISDINHFEHYFEKAITNIFF